MNKLENDYKNKICKIINNVKYKEVIRCIRVENKRGYEGGLPDICIVTKDYPIVLIEFKMGNSRFQTEQIKYLENEFVFVVKIFEDKKTIKIINKRRLIEKELNYKNKDILGILIYEEIIKIIKR